MNEVGNGRGFRKLRIALSATIAGAGISPLLADSALAAPTSLPASLGRTDGLITTLGSQSTAVRYIGGTNYSVTNSLTGPFATKGYGVTGAEVVYACPHTSGSGFTTCSITNKVSSVDAFGMVAINGKVFKNPDGFVDRTSPGEGGVLRSDKKKLAGIVTDVRHDFLPGNDVVLVLITMKNPKATAVKRTVDVGSVLSSSITAIHNTSDGDADLEQSDAWVTMSGSTDPVFIARGNAGKGALQLEPVPGDNLVDRYQLRFGPKKTIRLLYYVRVADTTGEIASIDDDFNGGAALVQNALVPNLTENEIKQIKNWTGLAP